MAAGSDLFRNEIIRERGSKQILLENPAGNPIELFEAPKGWASRKSKSRIKGHAWLRPGRATAILQSLIAISASPRGVVNVCKVALDRES